MNLFLMRSSSMERAGHGKGEAGAGIYSSTECREVFQKRIVRSIQFNS